jgi:hypothetical protein
MVKHAGLEDCGGTNVLPLVLPQDKHLVVARPLERLSATGEW